MINIARNGALGDIVMCSAVVAQFPGCTFYSGHPGLAKYFDCDVNIRHTNEWPYRVSGKDLFPIGYPKDHREMKTHLIERLCSDCGDPAGEMKLMRLDRIRPGKYVTVQRTSGWSAYKDYPHFDAVISSLQAEGIDVVELDERKTWSETLSLIAHAACHLGVDSVCNHIAGAYKTPAVIIFGSTNPVSSGYPTAVNLRHPDCEPCFIDTKFNNGYWFGTSCHNDKGPCIERVRPEVVFVAAFHQMGLK
jgi:hypothetical protein